MLRSLTWSIRIIRVELGSNPHSNRHLDYKDYGVQERLYESSQHGK